jgi:hypothetical protein
MAYDVTPAPADIILPFFRDAGSYHVPRVGAGRLAGEFPDGTTTVDGVPVAAEVRVLLRTASSATGDGAVVAVVQSAPDGTWLVANLPPGLKFDVVGRKSGHNDVIVANVSPEV